MSRQDKGNGMSGYPEKGYGLFKYEIPLYNPNSRK
jgi:hypothetical protein